MDGRHTFSLSQEEWRASKAFLRRYSLLLGYGLARVLLGRDAQIRLRRDVLLNNLIPLAIAAWASGDRRRSPSWYGFSASSARCVLLHSAVGGALGVAFVLGPSGKRMFGLRDEWERRLAGLSVTEATVLLGLGGVREEVIWRGWTYSEVEGAFQARSRRTRAAVAIGVSAFLFSSAHLLNFAEGPRRRLAPELQQMAAAAALGLIGGYWRHATGSIVPGLVLHNVTNMLRWQQTRAALLEERAGP